MKTVSAAKIAYEENSGYETSPIRKVVNNPFQD